MPKKTPARRTPCHYRDLALALVALTLLTAIGPAPAGAGPRPADAWAGFDASFESVAPRTGFLAAEVVDGACEPIHALRAEKPIAIASVVKLWVLAELVHQVDTGEAEWDDPLAIRQDRKSLPSGSMIEYAAGSSFPLSRYAEHMIRESDNTATDHLIHHLGRERIEDDLALFGHESPELNRPLLTTRELFTFRIGMSERQVEDYLAASETVRRTILKDVVGPFPLLEMGWGTWNSPEWVESVEWFASPADICRVMAYLHGKSSERGMEPLWGILMQNRGGVIDAGRWPDAGFKGGFEAGVYNLTWLLRRGDDRIFVLTAGFNDPARFVDQGWCGVLALQAVDVMARVE